METVRIEAFTVNGIKARTKNSNEADPATGKLAGLWQEFFTILGKQGALPACAYGVYNAYESDEHGEYDVIAGIKGEFPGDGVVAAAIPAGTYLKFEKEGPIPGACIELWQEIWACFQQPDCPVRTYNADFEAYEGENHVAIYIGIKEEGR